MPKHIFTFGGYAFFRDDFALWGCAPVGAKPPTHCGYATPEAVALLKNVPSAGLRAMAVLQWASLPE